MYAGPEQLRQCPKCQSRQVNVTYHVDLRCECPPPAREAGTLPEHLAIRCECGYRWARATLDSSGTWQKSSP